MFCLIFRIIRLSMDYKTLYMTDTTQLNLFDLEKSLKLEKNKNFKKYVHKVDKISWCF